MRPAMGCASVAQGRRYSRKGRRGAPSALHGGAALLVLPGVASVIVDTGEPVGTRTLSLLHPAALAVAVVRLRAAAPRFAAAAKKRVQR